jgi:hypothetical protein
MQATVFDFSVCNIHCYYVLTTYSTYSYIWRHKVEINTLLSNVCCCSLSHNCHMTVTLNTPPSTSRQYVSIEECSSHFAGRLWGRWSAQCNRHMTVSSKILFLAGQCLIMLLWICTLVIRYKKLNLPPECLVNCCVRKSMQ